MNIYTSILLWVTYIVTLYFSLFFFLVFFDKKLMPPSLTHRRGRLASFPFVSIIIPAYNEEETIVDTIASVLALDYPPDRFEVLIVDDGSTDGTRACVEKYINDKPVATLITHQNMGKAASLNHALCRAKGEFFACLDADSFVEPHALQDMLGLYYETNNPDLAIITPVLKVKSPHNLLQKVQWIEYLVMILVSRLASNLDCLYVAPGPFSLYKTSIIQKLGGFDEHNLTEDQEIAYRVQSHHYTIKQCPTAFVHTITPDTVPSFYRQRRRWYKGSISCLYKYRNLILNRRYGDFGIIQMLKNSFGFLVALSGVGFSFYFIVWPVIQRIYHLSLVGFDFWPYINHLTISFNILSVDIQKTFIVLVLFFIGFVFFYAAHRNAHERVNKMGIIPIIPYFFVYYILKGGILLLSVVEYSLKKDHKW